MIPYNKQSIDDSDLEAVRRVLKSDFLTGGPEIEMFEDALAKYTGAKYCVVVSSATAALHIAIAALEIEKGREAITSPNSFVASSNSMIYNGLIPVFSDIENHTWNLDAKLLHLKISKKTNLIMPVHFAGRACDMKAINELAKDKNISIIEDASHALGTRYQNDKKVGSCCYSDMTVFSFHPVKNITSGEGGVITTNDESLYKKLKLLRSHGIERDRSQLSTDPGIWYYEMQLLGFNYRMSDIHAALGRNQLNKLDGFANKRRQLFNRYNELFEGLGWLGRPSSDQNQNICFHLYVVQIDWNHLKKSRAEVMNFLKENGVLTQVLYIPIHLQPYYKANYAFKSGDFPVAESYYYECLALPLFVDMTFDQQDQVVELIKSMKK